MQGVRVSLKQTQSRRRRQGLCLALLLVSSFFIASAWAGTYDTNEALAGRLTALEKKGSHVVRLQLLAKSLAGRKIWLAELGTGTDEDRQTRPAMLVVAGAEGNDLVGSALVGSWLEGLVATYQEDPNLARLLETTTIYAVPRLNPDAAEHFFGTPKHETLVNGKPRDDDHDALVDEDGPEDLNGDGLITSMRVEDKEGQYILDSEEDRLLIEADPLKGEAGRWRYLSEGIDNDRDELWNEDGTGGVNFNRNFPFNQDFFATDAGVHPVCEVETRALADFIVTHPNIGIVLTYGMADNLLKTPDAAKKAPGRGKPMTAIDADDVPYYRALGEFYRETLGLDKELEGTSEPGTFSDWMYFHRGRLSLAVRPWSPKLAMTLTKDDEEKSEPEAEAKEEEQEKSESEKQTDKAKAKKKKDKDKDDRGKEQREQLKWFDEHAPEAFGPWQPFGHPDFPGQRVEIGGYAPGVLTNPPAGLLGDLTGKQSRFLTELIGRLPRIGLRQVKCTHLGESIFEIEIHIENTGFLPTILAHGERTREVHPTRLVLDVRPEQVLAGTRITYLPVMKGSGGAAEARWTLHAPDQSEIGFQVVSMLAGQIEGVIDLRDAGIYTSNVNHASATGHDDQR
jgi:Zinc carboxypeptidase